MDHVLLARYPFLKASAEFADSNDADIESLIVSPSYAEARKRGMQRVLDAIEHHKVSEVSLTSDYACLMEVLSYPYARILVSSVDDRFLTRRYALAEATRMYDLLKGDPAQSVPVSKELEVRSSIDGSSRISMPFADYLRYSCLLKAAEWKLINTELKDGNVLMERDRFGRVLQTALQERIESELPLKVPDGIRKAVRQDVDRVTLRLGEMKNRLSPTGGEGMNPEYLPPCIRAILANAQNGVNLPHSARFALVTFLHALGTDYDGIIALFSQSPDFDEAKSSYQIKHIIGELSGTDGYTPPECSTMKTNGLCFEPDGICNGERMNHPLTYYRRRSGTARKAP